MPKPDFIDAQLIISLLAIVTVVHAILGAVAYLIYVERKIAAYTSDRVGPNRTGFDFNIPVLKFLKGVIGLGQPLADGLKFILKEDYAARNVDKILFTLAPAAIIIPALMGFAIIPWGGTWMTPEFTLPILDWTFESQAVVIAGAPVNVGIIYLIAIASLGIYGVVLGGWASNNKYSLMGSLRASAQMISYEIPLGLSLLAVLLMTGTLIPEEIIDYQIRNGWLMISQPIAAIVFFIAILAESNRTPFDNAESETDLVGGYHTEYSSMRFALFFLAEYAHVITSSAFFVLLFMGGWHVFPFVRLEALEGTVNTLGEDGGIAAGLMGLLFVGLKIGVYAGKVTTLVIFFMFLRWTLPRLRYDQVMQMAWQSVIPIALGIVVMTSVMRVLQFDAWWQMLLANVGFFGLILLVQPLMPSSAMNNKVRLVGSRFHPPLGEDIVTAPTDPTALEDRPVEGTRPSTA